jgi:hypothetical protein
MRRFRLAFVPPRRLLGLLLLVAVATLVLQNSSVPHTHADVGPSLYNQDHDLALLATLHGAAVLVVAPPALLVFVLVAAIPPSAIPSAASAGRPTFDGRAPPLA